MLDNNMDKPTVSHLWLTVFVFNRSLNIHHPVLDGSGAGPWRCKKSSLEVEGQNLQRERSCRANDEAYNPESTFDFGGDASTDTASQWASHGCRYCTFRASIEHRNYQVYFVSSFFCYFLRVRCMKRRSEVGQASRVCRVRRWRT